MFLWRKRRKKILFVIPLAPIPVYRGSQTRINSIVKYFASKSDFEVHVCVLNRSFGNKSSKQYASEIKDFYKGVESVRVLKSIFLYKGIKRRLKAKIYNFMEKTIHKNKLSNFVNCPPEYRKEVASFIGDIRFDAVFVNYAYAMPVIPDNYQGLCVLDTHDFQTNHLLSDVVNNNVKLDVDVEKFKKDEIALLSKADVVIAINPNEALEFRNFLPDSRRVITIPQFFESNYDNLPPYWGHKYDALFLGSKANFNIQGIIWFLENVFDKVLQNKPNFKLCIAGDVSKNEVVIKFFDKYHENIELLGRVQDVSAVYAQWLCCTTLFETEPPPAPDVVMPRPSSGAYPAR